MASQTSKPDLHKINCCSNHLFNSHHIELISSQKLSQKEQILEKCQNTTQRNSLGSNKYSHSLKRSRIDVIEEAIQEVSSYYKTIQIQIERYKNQQINELIRLKQTSFVKWEKSQKKNRKIIRSPENQRKIIFKRQVFFSPLSEAKNFIQNMKDFISKIRSNIQKQIKLFPLIGREWIKLSKKESGQTIQGSFPKKQLKVEVQKVWKKNEFMNLSQIEKSMKENDQSSFVSKNAFRQLFPGEQKTTGDDTSSF